MKEAFLAPGVVYVKVRATFREDGFLVPETMEWGRVYVPLQVRACRCLESREWQRIFPGPPRHGEYILYQYSVRISGRDLVLYLDRWPESGCQSLGRWFVIRKEVEEK